MKFKGILSRIKNFSKSLKIVLATGFVVVIVIVLLVIKSVTGGKTDFYSIVDKAVTTEVGNYKYVIDITSKEHTDAGATESSNISEKALNNLEVEDSTSSSKSAVTKHSDSVSSSWGNSTSTEKVDWSYPKYEITVSGRTESVNPLKGTMNIALSTDYVSQDLVNITIIDGKYYIDLSVLRKWLKASKDSNLVALVSSIPENAVYLVVSDNSLRFYSQFAEDSEYEVSGTTNVVELYRRFIVLEKTITSLMRKDLGNTGLSTSNDKYLLSLKNESSTKLVKSLGSELLNSGSLYKNFISTLSKNKLASSEQVSQLVNETDNILSANAKNVLWLSTATTSDIEKSNVSVEGWGRLYQNAKKQNTYEFCITMGYTSLSTNTDYTIAIQGEKQPLSSSEVEVSIPTGATCTLDQVKASKGNLSTVVSSLVDYFDVFNIFNRVKLDSSPDVVVDNLVTNFISLVNERNLSNSDWIKINDRTVTSYIEKYSSMTATSTSSADDNLNISLVKDFMTNINTLTGTSIIKETIKEAADIEQFREISANTVDFKIIANVNIAESNSKLIVINSTILNTSDSSVTVNLNKLSLQDIQSNKFPCNYKTQLHEYDNGFDMTNAPESITLKTGTYADVKLYVVVPDGFKYFDLFFNSDKLGDIIAY